MKTFGDTLGELAGHDILHRRGDLDPKTDGSRLRSGKAQTGTLATAIAWMFGRVGMAADRQSCRGAIEPQDDASFPPIIDPRSSNALSSC